MYFERSNPKNGLELFLKAMDLSLTDPKIRDLAARKKGVQMSDPRVQDEIGSLNKVLAIESQSLSFPYNLSPMTAQGVPGSPADYLRRNDFMVWSSSRQVAKATVRASDAWFTSGNSGKATDSLLLQLKVSHQTLPASGISMLVSVAVDAIAYAGFGRNLSRLKQRDVDAILHGDVLLSEEIYRRAIVNDAFPSIGEAEITLRALDQSLKKPIPGNAEPEERKSILYYRSLSPAKRKIYPAKVRSEFLAAYRQLAAHLHGPEHDWPFDEVKLPRSFFSDPVVGPLLDLSTSTIPGMLASIARSRTQARLLRLSAYLQRFRLVHGRLPMALAELHLPKSETFDPLSNREFVYQPKSDPIVMSPGVPKIGPVGLTPLPRVSRRGMASR